MKFLIYFQNKKQSLYYKYLYESTFNCSVVEVESPEKFLSECSSPDYAFVLYSPDGSVEKKVRPKSPAICLGKEDVSALLKKTSELIGVDLNKRQNDEQFIPLKIDYFYKIHLNTCDVYLKLSDSKYLKVFKADHDLSSIEILRLKKKSIEQLYVKTSDFEKLVDSMVEDEIVEDSVDEEKMLDELSFAHDVFHQITNRIGLNEKAIICANKSMELLYNLIDKEENLSALWAHLMKRRNFVTEHSLMLGYLSSAILSQTAFYNDSNSIKLTLAALMHDIGLQKESHAKWEQFGIDEENMSARELASFKDHLQAGVNVFLKLENGPLDTDKIIMHHHEKYDGSGFPRGLGWSKLPFLSIVFIVAHELVVYCAARDCKEEDIDRFISQKKLEYTEGSFKEIMLALEKVRK